MICNKPGTTEKGARVDGWRHVAALNLLSIYEFWSVRAKTCAKTISAGEHFLCSFQFRAGRATQKTPAFSKKIASFPAPLGHFLAKNTLA